MWLLFAWLLVQPDLDRPPAHGLGSSLFALGDHVGHVGIALGVGVGAYFAGTLSQALSAALKVLWTAVLREAWYRLPRPLGDVFGVAGAPQPPEADEISRVAARTMVAAAGVERDPPDVEAVANRAIAEARAELSLPATVLVGKEPELFAEVDRLRAEGDLRLAAVPPAVALAILAGVKTSAWFLLGVLPAMLLLDLGVRRLHSSQQLVADAKVRGLVPSQALQRFRAWAETVEADPEASPPPPWQPRGVRAPAVLQVQDVAQRKRIERLSTFTEIGLAENLETLRRLTPRAGHALVQVAHEEMVPDRRLLSNRRRSVPTARADARLEWRSDPDEGALEDLSRLGLLAYDATPSNSWRLTDRGIAVASLLTAPLPEDPQLSRQLMAQRRRFDAWYG